MTTRREKAAFAAVVIGGALLGLFAATRPWVTTFVPDPIAERTLSVDGRQAAGVVPAVALVALAGSVAVLTTQTVGRLVAGTLLVLAGAASATASVGVLRTPAAAVDAAVTRATGRSGVTDVTTSVTAWPWLGVASGALVLLGGCLTVLRARAWGRPTRRFDVPEPAAVRQIAPIAPEDDPGATWDALSRGEDPTH